MPVPYKHQLRRAQAVDELDWPPQASSSGSSDSLGSGEAATTQKDGIFKVMLVGESGVGKSSLAGTFGGLQGDSAHEPENPGISGSPARVEGASRASQGWESSRHEQPLGARTSKKFLQCFLWQPPWRTGPGPGI